jgi:hypothetical protein
MTLEEVLPLARNTTHMIGRPSIRYWWTISPSGRLWRGTPLNHDEIPEQDNLDWHMAPDHLLLDREDILATDWVCKAISWDKEA